MTDFEKEHLDKWPDQKSKVCPIPSDEVPYYVFNQCTVNPDILKPSLNFMMRGDSQ